MNLAKIDLTPFKLAALESVKLSSSTLLTGPGVPHHCGRPGLVRRIRGVESTHVAPLGYAAVGCQRQPQPSNQVLENGALAMLLLAVF